MLGHIHRALTIATLALTALILGCGGSAETVVRQPPLTQEESAPKKPEADKRPLAYYEATLRPTDFDKEIEEVQRIHIEERRREALIIPRDSVVLVSETILGFRIQILSTASVDEAEENRAAAQQLFWNDTVYVVYDPPVYKVRVGDFPNRLEANAKLPEVQERGYKDGWVVPDKVVRRRWMSVARGADEPGEE